MVWARLKVVNSAGSPEERVVNLDQVQWWVGKDKTVEPQFASHLPVTVEISDKQMERLTGTSGGYAAG